MVITYYGGETFRLQFGDLSIAVNPRGKKSALKSVRFGADIALVGRQDADHNGVEEVEQKGKETFIIDGPGEYEVRDIVIAGFAAPDADDGSIRTLYRLTLEGMQVGILTGLHTKELGKAAAEALSDVEILLIPISGDTLSGKGTPVLSPAESSALAVSLGVGIIIPMHTGSKTDTLKTFLREGGQEGVKPMDKLTIKKKDVMGKEGEIVVLKAP